MNEDTCIVNAAENLVEVLRPRVLRAVHALPRGDALAPQGPDPDRGRRGASGGHRPSRADLESDGQWHDDLRLFGCRDRPRPLVDREVPRRVPAPRDRETVSGRRRRARAVAGDARELGRRSREADIAAGGAAPSGGGRGSAPPRPRRPPAKDTFTVVFDGVRIEVPKNLNLIEAAKLAGIEIPHFCFHPRLSVVGQCRMCLVEIEGIPRSRPRARRRSRTAWPSRRRRRRWSSLARRTWSFSSSTIRSTARSATRRASASSRTTRSDTETRSPTSTSASASIPGFDRTLIGPHVIADMTRCIQCTRCIRFCQEIAGTGELTFLDRGGPNARLDARRKAARQRLVGLRRRRLPRRRADRARISLPQPRLVSGEDAVGMPRLQHRLQHLDRVERFRRLSFPAPLESGGQRLLALRLRTVLLGEAQPARHRAGEPSAKAEGVEGRDRAGGRSSGPRRRSARRSTASGRTGLFFLGSAHLSNEENFLLRKLADHSACPNRDAIVDLSRGRAE